MKIDNKDKASTNICDAWSRDSNTNKENVKGVNVNCENKKRKEKSRNNELKVE